MKTTTTNVREALKTTVDGIISDFRNDPETDRETLIERMDEETDLLFGNLVRYGLISDYTIEDAVDTVGPCAAILEVAREDAWIEDDSGLWDGLTYGVIASIAYFSLRNLLYQALDNAGVDSNEDQPFAELATVDE